MILADDLILRFVVINGFGHYLAGIEIEPIFEEKINQAIMFHSYEEAELYINEMDEKVDSLSNDVKICAVELVVSFIDKMNQE